jgi:DNA-binding CsgD family transcriptional regulator
VVEAERVATDGRARAVVSPAGGESALLERDREVGVLRDLIQRALEGYPALALVDGPAGIGKSRLLEATREAAGAAGFRVLAARGSDLERELPFGVVRQLFDPLVVNPAERARWLTGPAEPAARVFEPPDDGDAAPDVSFGVLYGLFWLTANVAAEGPLLLVIDDLHWCDQASLRFVAYLERRLEGLQMLVAAAARTSEQRPDSRLLAEIADDPAAVSIRPVELSGAAVAELVRGRLGAAAELPFCVACHEATGGNPLLVRELLKTLQGEGVQPDGAHADVIREVRPRSVSRTVLLRLARLPSDAAPVARAVAVLGDGAGLPAVAALAELDEDRVADAARALAGADILRAEPPLGFVHSLVRDAVYHDLSAAERELLHERAAKGLVGLGAAPELVAAQLLAVPRRAELWVVTQLREAALAARRRGATESAVSYLRRALEEPPPADQREPVLLELGLVEGFVNAPAAVEHISQVKDHLVDPQARAHAAAMLGRMLLFTRPPQEAAAVVQRALADIPAELGGPRRALAALELYTVAFGAEVPDAAERLARVRAAGLGKGLGAAMLSGVAAWDWALRGGTAEECAELALAVLADGRLIALDAGFMTLVPTGVLVLSDRDEALTVCDAALSSAHQMGSLPGVSSVSVWRGWAWLGRGELAEAEDALRQGLEGIVLMEEQNGAGMAYAVGFLARVLLERGDLDGARAALGSCPQPTPGSDGDALVRGSTVELSLAEGDWARALAEADLHHERLGGVENVAWAPWRSLKAQALDGLDRRVEALALLDEELVEARRWGAPGSLARTLRLLGTMRRKDGLDLLREAVEVADGSAARLEHAKALTALGLGLRRAGQLSDAREPLRRGLELASRCSAEPLAKLARAELYAVGGRPRREALTGPESLTPSERRVADLAADGQSHRDIAQALYVTPRTVEFHLTGVYRKLGISTRAELAAALAGPDPA